MIAAKVAPFHGLNLAVRSSGPSAGGRGAGIHPNADKTGRWLLTPGCTISHLALHYKVTAVDQGVVHACPVNARGLVRTAAGRVAFQCRDVVRVLH